MIAKGIRHKMITKDIHRTAISQSNNKSIIKLTTYMNQWFTIDNK